MVKSLVSAPPARMHSLSLSLTEVTISRDSADFSDLGTLLPIIDFEPGEVRLDPLVGERATILVLTRQLVRLVDGDVPSSGKIAGRQSEGLGLSLWSVYR